MFNTPVVQKKFDYIIVYLKTFFQGKTCPIAVELSYTRVLLRPNIILAGLLATANTSLCICSGVSASFAVKLFKSWLSEKDISSVAPSLRKVGMDNRLMVRMMIEMQDLKRV